MFQFRSPEAVDKKLQQLNEIITKSPDCLTPPDLSKVLGMKTKAVHEWLESPDCPFPKIIYRPKVENRSASGRKTGGVHTGRVVYKIPTPPFYHWYMSKLKENQSPQTMAP